MADQLTLFKLGGQVMTNPLLLAHPPPFSKSYLHLWRGGTFKVLRWGNRLCLCWRSLVPGNTKKKSYGHLTPVLKKKNYGEKCFH